MKICIDAGHGGHDSGAVAIHSSGGIAMEKDLTLQYALGLNNLLGATGEHTTVLTRSKDVFLYPGARLRLALRFNCDLFISIHCNSSANNQAHGMEVLYRDEYDLPLAQSMHDALAEIMPGISSRGLKNDVEDLHRQLTVLDNLVLPTCLVEVGFISNEGDRNELLKVTQVAEALSTGIARYVAERGA